MKALVKATSILTVVVLAASLLGCKNLAFEETAANEIEISVTQGALSSDEAAVYGDLTGDGDINVVDLQCMALTIKAVMGSKPMPACLTEKSAADLTCDGNINVVDYQLVILKVQSDGPLNPAIDADQNGVHDDCETPPADALVEAPQATVYGDLTGDGAINVVDLQCFLLTLQAVMGGTEMPSCLTSEEAADMNCDGKINVVDFQLIIQKVVNGGPLNPAIDADQNGVHDNCEAAPEEASDETVYGDLTGDGAVNVVDLQCFTLTIQAVMGGTEMPSCLTSEEAADMNCDGKINVVDFQLVIQKVVNGGPLNPAIDADQNGVHDNCEAAPEEEETFLYGDATGDGAINVVDVQCVRLTVIAEMKGAEELPECLVTDDAADLDCDGANTVVDYKLIVQKALSDGPLNEAIDANQNGIHDHCE